MQNRQINDIKAWNFMMNGESRTGLREFLPFIGMLGAVIAITFWIYSFGLGGSWHFDDPANLDGLENISDLQSGLHFIFSGQSGPTGRPLSLATFALQAEQYPDNPAAFLQVNIILHLLNLCLVFLAALLLARTARMRQRHALWIALMTSAIWGLSPFLASANLLIIQRMTSLSAVFVFLGLILFLAGRFLYETRPRTGLLLIWSSILAMTGLATLAKENGALLPCLLLLIELFFRPDPSWRGSRARKVCLVVLATLSIAIIGFIVAAALASSTFDFRNFSMLDRSLTQPRVIWDYILNLLLPRSTAGNPFTDTFPISRGFLEPVSTMVAMVSLLGIVAAIVVFAKRLPLVSFGLAFFLVAHLSESTFLYLEIYFSHRNYVPAFGLYLALAAGVAQLAISSGKQKLAIGGGFSYAAVMAFALFTITNTWGNPSTAANQWFAQRPDSVRAALFLAGNQLDNNLYFSAIDTLNMAYRANPGDIYILTQSLMLCDVERAGLDEHLQILAGRLREVERINHNEANGLHSLALRVSREPCVQITAREVSALIELTLEGNKAYQNREAENLVLYAAAQLAAAQEDYAQANTYLEKSLKLAPERSTVIRIAYNYVLMGQRERAVERLEAALNAPPEDAFARLPWEREINDYRNSLLQD